MEEANTTKGKIVVFKNGSHMWLLDGVTFEYENDPEFLCTIDLDKLGLTGSTETKE